MKEKKDFVQKILSIQFTLWIRPFPSVLTWEVPEKEISSLSMQKCSSIPVSSSSPPSQESYFHPASALTQTYLFLLLNLRAVELWAVFDRGISVSLLHFWCMLCILFSFSIFLPAWQVGSRPFTKNVIASNASWDNLQHWDKHFAGIERWNSTEKKARKDKCSLLLCNFCFCLIFFFSCFSQ